MESAKIQIELPDAVYVRLEKTIQDCVERALQKNIEKIQAEPELLTRAQVAKRLRITLPTLRKLETDGKLIPERAGRRVLYDKRAIDLFLRP